MKAVVHAWRQRSGEHRHGAVRTMPRRDDGWLAVLPPTIVSEFLLNFTEHCAVDNLFNAAGSRWGTWTRREVSSLREKRAKSRSKAH